MKNLILIWVIFYTSLAQAVPPTGIKSQNGAINYSVNTIVPGSQATKLAGNNVLIETDSENLFVNPGFENTAVSTGWTLGTSNTLTANTTSANLYGASAQSGALTTSATVAFDLHQYITPPSGVTGTQGEVQWAMAVPVGITDGQICSVVNSAEVLCISVIADGAFRRYKLPIIFGTAGQNAGIKFKTAATYASGTQTVYVEKASISIGSTIDNLQLDVVYTARVGTAGGVPSAQNLPFMGSCVVTGTSVYTCPLTAFTVAPTCLVSPASNAVTEAQVNSASATQLVYTLRNSAGTVTAGSANIQCEKQGADYLTASSSVYASSSANTDWMTYTPTISGFGTVTNLSAFYKREGSDLLVRMSFTQGTVAGSTASITLPSALSIDASKITLTSSVGSDSPIIGSYAGATAGAGAGVILASTTTSASTVYFGNTYGNVATTTISARNGNVVGSTGAVMSVSFRVPITGWANASYIIGSFAGYGYAPGVNGRVDTFSVNYGTTTVNGVCTGSPCFIDQIGTGVTSITRSGTGAYTLNTATTYTKLKCSLTLGRGTSDVAMIPYNAANGYSCSSCSSISFTTVDAAGNPQNSNGLLMCQGSY